MKGNESNGSGETSGAQQLERIRCAIQGCIGPRPAVDRKPNGRVSWRGGVILGGHIQPEIPKGVEEGRIRSYRWRVEVFCKAAGFIEENLLY